MAQEWFVTRDGTSKSGPMSGAQLQELARSGQLLPTDKVWKQGMTQWVSASTVKGLFVKEAITAMPPTPMIQQAVPQAVPVQIVPVQQGIALWNPTAVRWWSLLFTWVFGSILLAKNWRALGQPARARRLMIWCYASIPYALLLLLPMPQPMSRGISFLSMAILVVWFVVEAAPHVKYVQQNVGSNYVKKAWAAPLGIAAGSLLGFVVVAAAILTGAERTTTYQDDMMEIICPNCHNKLRLARKYEGMQGKCPACGRDFIVPSITPVAKRGNKRQYTRADFRDLVTGKTKEDVLNVLGRPDETQEIGDQGQGLQMEMWYYRNKTIDPVTNRIDFQAQVVFQNGRVSSVNY